MGIADDIIRAQYQRQGLQLPGPYGSEEEEDFAPLPYPVPEEPFYEAEVQKAVETPWHAMFTKPLGWLMRALGAGEYGVASFVRSLVRSGQGYEAANPIEAFVRGVAAGFNDDPEFQTRMTDVLTEMGWEPESGTGESWTKEGLGFALGMLFDPITWLTGGTAAGARTVTKSLYGKVAKEAGVELAEGVGRRALSKKGGALVEQIVARNKAELQKALPEGQALEALHMVPAYESAARTLARLTLNTPGKTAQEAIAIKGADSIDEALKLLGRVPSEKSREWFVNGGYKQLLDPGGLKIKNPFTWDNVPLVSGERFSQIFGVMSGAAWAKDIPLIAALGNKLTPGAMWSQMTKPIRDFLDFFKKNFSRFTGKSDELRNSVARLEGLQAQGYEAANRMTAGLLYGAKGGREMSVPIGTQELMVQTLDIAPLSKGEQHLLGRLLHDANQNVIVPERLEEFFIDHIKRNAHWLKERGINLKTVTPEDVSRYAKVGQNILHMWERVRSIENILGIGGDVIDTYTPHMFKGFKRGDKLVDMQRKGAYDWFNIQRESRAQFEYENLRKAWQDGKIGGLPEDDLQKIIMARLGASMSKALERDFVDEVMQKIARVAVTPAMEKKIRRILEKHPHLAMVLGEASVGVDVPATAELHKAIEAFWDDLRGAQPNQVFDVVQKFSPPPSISDAVGRELMQRYSVEVDKLAGQLSRQEASGAARISTHEKLVKMRQAQGSFQRKVEDAASSTWQERYVSGKLGQNRLVMDRDREIVAARKRFEGVDWGIPNPRDFLTVESDGVTEAVQGISSALERNVFRRLAIPGVPRAQSFARGKAAIQNMEQNLTRGRDLLDRYEMARNAMRGDLPGSVSRVGEAARIGNFETMAEALSEANIHVTNRQWAIRRRLAAIEDARETTSGMTAATRAAMRVDDAAERAVLLAEWDHLTAIERRLPEFDTVLDVFKNRARYDRHMTRIGNIVQHAQKNGWRDELPALVDHVSNGRTLNTMSPAAVKKIEDIISNKERISKQIVSDIIEPKENVVQAENLAKMTVHHPVTGELVPASKFSARVEDLKGINEVLTKEEAAGAGYQAIESILTNTIDYPTRWMKNLLTWQMVPFIPAPRPAFFVRNAIDLAVRSVLGFGVRGLLPGTNWKFGDVLKIAGRGEGEVVLGGMKYTYDDIRKVLHEANIWRYDTPRVDIRPRGTIKEMVEGLDTGQYVAPYMIKQKVAQGLERRGWSGANPARWGSAMENVFTVEAVMAMLNKNIPMDEIVTRLRHVFFDFNDVTAFERHFMKRATLFYGFMRQAVPWALKETARHPWILGAQGRIRDMASDTSEEKAAIPKWVQDYPFVAFGKTEKGIRVMSLRNVFSFDVLADMLPGEFENAFGQINPLFTAPVELWMGRDLYMGRDLKQDRVLGTSPSNFMLSSPLGAWLEARPVKLKDGKEYIKVNSYKWHALRKLHFGRLFAEADDIAKAVEGDKPAEAALLRLGVGFKVMDIEYERRQMIMKSAAERAQMEYNRAVKSGDNHRARKILEEIRYR